MNELQERVVKLLDNAEPKENLEEWVNGYIPKHYRRISIGMDEAIELAEIGAHEAYASFETKLYFTQSLIMGAAVTERYQKMRIITSSQYGKSWLFGQIAIWFGSRSEQVYVAGGDGDTTDIIFSKVLEHIQDASDEIKEGLLETTDRIERLQTSLSKSSLSWKGGGSIDKMPLGETFKNSKKANKAIGRAGHVFTDEASMISDDADAETGRGEFASEDGVAYLDVQISNPHNAGRFWNDIIAEDVPDDTLIIWMDIRTAYEEGRVKSKRQVINSKFFKNKSTCKRYLLCELEDYSEESLFDEPVVDDSKPSENATYFLGIDSAYKGKDDIQVFLTALDRGKIRLLDCAKIDKSNWVDGETGIKATNDVMKFVNTFMAKYLCVDIGYGVWLVENLAQRAKGFTVKGINFGSGVTDGRKKAKHYAAQYGANKRAEMHLDLQDLMEHGKATFTSKMAAVLKEQMNAVRAVRKTGGKIAIIPKDEIKQIIGKSPDELDAALLSVHAALLHSMSGGLLLYQDD